MALPMRLFCILACIFMHAWAVDAQKSSGKPIASACKGFKYIRYISVRSNTELQRAMDNAKAGDLIELKAGTYSPIIRTGVSPAAPVCL